MKGRKAVYTVFMGSLTGIAMTACTWQYRRYFQSVERWRIISQQMEEYAPIQASDIDW